MNDDDDGDDDGDDDDEYDNDSDGGDDGDDVDDDDQDDDDDDTSVSYSRYHTASTHQFLTIMATIRINFIVDTVITTIKTQQILNIH